MDALSELNNRKVPMVLLILVNIGKKSAFKKQYIFFPQFTDQYPRLNYVPKMLKKDLDTYR